MIYVAYALQFLLLYLYIYMAEAILGRKSVFYNMQKKYKNCYNKKKLKSQKKSHNKKRKIKYYKKMC